MSKILLNAGVFQAGWFLSVLFGNVIAIMYAALACLIYLRYFLTSKRDLGLFAAVLLVGFIGDSLLGLTGVLVHPNGLPFPPIWMVVLWLLFAMTLPWSLRPLMRRRGVFLVLCAVGGTLSYVAGVRLTSISFGYTTLNSTILLSGLWLAHGSILLALVRRWELGK